MNKFFYILLFLFITIGCSNLSNNRTNDLIARAGEDFLYGNDLPNFTSEEDSIRKFMNFVESWAKEKVLYDLSLVNLSQSKKNEIDELVNNYKVDLYINSYKDLIVNTRIDSIVSISQIDSFYEQNNTNFKLNDSIWFTERDVISSIQFINQQNKSRYLSKNKLFTIEDSQYINFFIVKDILKSGNIHPISYLYERIKSTIINQRKLQLLQSLNKEILNDALKSRKYEVFN